jgi:hypothetical protein
MNSLIMLVQLAALITAALLVFICLNASLHSPSRNRSVALRPARAWRSGLGQGNRYAALGGLSGELQAYENNKLSLRIDHERPQLERLIRQNDGRDSFLLAKGHSSKLRL